MYSRTILKLIQYPINPHYTLGAYSSHTHSSDQSYSSHINVFYLFTKTTILLSLINNTKLKSKSTLSIENKYCICLSRKLIPCSKKDISINEKLAFVCIANS